LVPVIFATFVDAGLTQEETRPQVLSSYTYPEITRLLMINVAWYGSLTKHVPHFLFPQTKSVFPRKYLARKLGVLWWMLPQGS
jgi:hypothetical protein